MLEETGALRVINTECGCGSKVTKTRGIGIGKKIYFTCTMALLEHPCMATFLLFLPGKNVQQLHFLFWIQMIAEALSGVFLDMLASVENFCSFITCFISLCPNKMLSPLRSYLRIYTQIMYIWISEFMGPLSTWLCIWSSHLALYKLKCDPL